MAKIHYDHNISLISFVAFDLETTGLTAGADKIVEISGIKFQNQVTYSTFETLVDPEVPISAEITRINGITNEMVLNKPTIENVLPHFLDFIKGCVIMAHNAAFDLGFLNAALKNQNLPVINQPLIDTLILARRTIPNQPNYKLQSLAAFLKIDPGNAHRAKDDAVVCKELFYHCLSRVKDGAIMPLEKLLQLAAQ